MKIIYFLFIIFCQLSYSQKKFVDSKSNLPIVNLKFIDENVEPVNFDDDSDFIGISMMLTSQIKRGWEIADAYRERTYEGGLTYNGHPISLAAAIATIRVMQEDKLVEKAAATGEAMADMLAELKERHPSVGEVRSIGLFGIMELVRDRKTKEPMAPFNGGSPEMTAFRKYMLDHGVFLYTHWHTALIIPPLPITTEQLMEGFSVLDQALEITDQAAR